MAAFIVVEGVDGSGKTSLVKKITEEYRRQHVAQKPISLHYGVPEYDPRSPLTIGMQAMNQLLEPLQAAKFHPLKSAVVVDRFHLGEPVYAPIFRPGLCVDPTFGTLEDREFDRINAWLNSLGAVIVYLDVDPDVAMARLAERDDEELLSGNAELRRKQLEALRVRYDMIVEVSSRRSILRPVTATLETEEQADSLAAMVVDRAHSESQRKLKKARTVNKLDNKQLKSRLRLPFFEERELAR